MLRRMIRTVAAIAMVFTLLAVGSPAEADTKKKATLQFGPKVGLNFAKIFGPEIEASAERNPLLGVAVGGHGFWNVTPWVGIQTEVMYTVKGNRIVTPTDEGEVEVKERHNYLQVPVLFRLNLPLPEPIPLTPKLMFGPGFSFWLDGSVERDAPGGTTERDLDADDDDIETFEFGLIAALGTDIHLGAAAITFDVRYERGLTSIIEQPPEDAPQHNLFSIHGGLTVGF